MTTPDVDVLSQFAQGSSLSETDSLTPLFLNAAVDVVRNYCEWHVFPRRTDTVVLDGPGGELLALPSAYVVAVTSVSESGTSLVEGTDFEWSASGRLRKLSGVWTERYRSISVTMQHGYDAAPDLLATIYAIATRAASSPQGATVDGAGPFSFSAAQLSSGSGGGLGLFAHEKAILDRYALVRP